jgi:drug/metabolite transporter (DMT)-like permease
MTGSVPRHPTRYAVVALVLLALFWGYNWVVMKVVLKDCGPFTFAALRTMLGALVLFPMLPFKGGLKVPKAVSKLILLGLLQTTAFLGLTFWALVQGGVGKTAVLVYTMPFWLLIMAWVFLGERVRGIEWLAVIAAFAGMFLIFEPWNTRTGLWSESLAVLAGVSWAGSVIAVKRIQMKERIPLLQLTTWQMLFGGIGLAIVAFFVPEGPINWSPMFIAALAYNVIPCNAIAWLLWLYIVENLPAGAAGMGSLAIPLVGILSAWLQLGEIPGQAEGAGMVLICSALLILSVKALRGR